MAKDAKGHGSEARGAEQAIKADNDAAVSRLTPAYGAGVGYRTPGNAGVSDKQAAGALAQGADKSLPPPVHPAMVGDKPLRVAAPQHAWGQTPAVAKQARSQLRKERAFRTFAKHGYGNG